MTETAVKFRHLRTLVEVSRQQSVGRAAEVLHVSQPAVTKTLCELEAAVGAIVSNVSASAVQLEQAAGTLTRTAETTQSLSSQVAGASEEASSNMQSVATATEELSASVDEIGRRVRDSNRIADAAVRQAQETDGRIGKLSRAAQEIGGSPDPRLLLFRRAWRFVAHGCPVKCRLEYAT